MLGLDTSTLSGLFAGAVLYGLYVALFATSLYILLCRRSDGRPNLVLLIASIVLFIIITLMLALSLSINLDAFIVYRSTIDPNLFLQNVLYWKSLTLQVLGLFICLFGDVILIYRGWLIWAQSWRAMAVPMVMFLASIAVLIFIVVELTQTATYVPSDATKLNQGLDAFIILTLVQNILVTSLIVWRLWRIDSAVAPYRNARSLLPVIWIIVESGFLYSATLLTFLVVSLVDPWVSVIMSSILYVMIGITFSSIIVRVGLSSEKRITRSGVSSHNMHPIPLSISRRTEVEIVAEIDLSSRAHSVSSDTLAKQDPPPKESCFGKYPV